MSKKEETLRRLESLQILNGMRPRLFLWPPTRTRYRASISSLLHLRWKIDYHCDEYYPCYDCSSNLALLQGTSDLIAKANGHASGDGSECDSSSLPRDGEVAKVAIAHARSTCHFFCLSCWRLVHPLCQDTALTRLMMSKQHFGEVLDSLEKLNEDPVGNILLLRKDFSKARFQPLRSALPLAQVVEPKQLKATH